MSDWRPIATAPKDGTHILLLEECDPDDYDGSICLAFWGSAYDGEEDHWCDWGAAGAHNEEFFPEPHNPTHWMPLPSPPEWPDQGEG